MTPVPLSHALGLAGVLLAIGAAGLVARRSLLLMLVSVEIMFNAGLLAVVAAGARWGQPDGQVVFLFGLAAAGAEVSVGLALLVALWRRRGSIDADAARGLREA